eukprot:938112_1
MHICRVCTVACMSCLRYLIYSVPTFAQSKIVTQKPLTREDSLLLFILSEIFLGLKFSAMKALLVAVLATFLLSISVEAAKIDTVNVATPPLAADSEVAMADVPAGEDFEEVEAMSGEEPDEMMLLSHGGRHHGGGGHGRKCSGHRKYYYKCRRYKRCYWKKRCWWPKHCDRYSGHCKKKCRRYKKCYWKKRCWKVWCPKKDDYDNEGGEGGGGEGGEFPE